MSDVGSAVAHQAQRLGGFCLDEPCGDARKLAFDVSEKLGDKRARGIGKRGNPDGSGVESGELGNLTRHCDEAGVDARRMPGEEHAHVGQADCAPRPGEHVHADAGFEALQVLGDRGLAVAELKRRTGDGAGVVDRLDDAQRMQIECSHEWLETIDNIVHNEMLYEPVTT